MQIVWRVAIRIREEWSELDKSLCQTSKSLRYFEIIPNPTKVRRAFIQKKTKSYPLIFFLTYVFLEARQASLIFISSRVPTCRRQNRSMDYLLNSVSDHWPFWLISVTLLAAAVIDGIYLKVPNWLTFPLIATGWAYSLMAGSWTGLGWSLAGSAVGLLLLLVVYSIGGMGAGDVKLLAGIGAWVQLEHTFWIFVATTIIGGLMALVMMLLSGRWEKHLNQMKSITEEIVVLHDPERLFDRAAKRKSKMLLLPYGIPMTVAALGYFFSQGLLL